MMSAEQQTELRINQDRATRTNDGLWGHPLCLVLVCLTTTVFPDHPVHSDSPSHPSFRSFGQNLAIPDGFPVDGKRPVVGPALGMVLLYGFQHINSYLLLLYHAAISVVGAEMFQHDRRLGQWYLVALFLPLAAVQLAFPGPQSWGALCGFSFYIISLSVRLRRLCAIYASRLAETRDLEASVQPDSLTGLFNRAAMQNHMDRELKGAADTGRRVALLFNLKTAVDLSGRPQALESIEFATASHFTNLVTTAVSVTACSHKTWPENESSTAVFRFIDLDGFKATSDTCSHRTGDLFLCEIADRLNRFAGSGLRVARLGGDEFTLLVTDVKLTISRPALLAFAESVLAAVCVPGSIEGRMCAVTASIGVGMFHDDATNAEHLIRAADRAMYEAKRTGKRRICAFGARQLLDLHAPPESHLPAELERLDDALSRPPSVAYSRLLTG